jgi:hypothetical protein
MIPFRSCASKSPKSRQDIDAASVGPRPASEIAAEEIVALRQKWPKEAADEKRKRAKRFGLDSKIKGTALPFPRVMSAQGVRNEIRGTSDNARST